MDVRQPRRGIVLAVILLGVYGYVSWPGIKVAMRGSEFVNLGLAPSARQAYQYVLEFNPFSLAVPFARAGLLDLGGGAASLSVPRAGVPWLEGALNSMVEAIRVDLRRRMAGVNPSRRPVTAMTTDYAPLLFALLFYPWLVVVMGRHLWRRWQEHPHPTPLPGWKCLAGMTFVTLWTLLDAVMGTPHELHAFFPASLAFVPVGLLGLAKYLLAGWCLLDLVSVSAPPLGAWVFSWGSAASAAGAPGAPANGQNIAAAPPPPAAAPTAPPSTQVPGPSPAPAGAAVAAGAPPAQVAASALPTPAPAPAGQVVPGSPGAEAPVPAAGPANGVPPARSWLPGMSVVFPLAAVGVFIGLLAGHSSWGEVPGTFRRLASPLPAEQLAGRPPYITFSSSRGKAVVKPASGVKMRVRPGRNFPINGVLACGETCLLTGEIGPYVTVDGITAPWVGIVADGQEGWVFGGYLRPE